MSDGYDGLGTSASQTALGSADGHPSPASGLGPSGAIASAQDFNPESYEGKPRWLPKPENELLRSFVDPLYDRVEAMSFEERRLLIQACMNVSPINCGWDAFAMAKILIHTAIFDQTVAVVEADPPA